MYYNTWKEAETCNQIVLGQRLQIYDVCGLHRILAAAQWTVHPPILSGCAYTCTCILYNGEDWGSLKRPVYFLKSLISS